MRTLFLLLLITGCLVSCNGNPGSNSLTENDNEPSSVAIAFRTNLVMGNMDEAKKLGTEPTKQILNRMAISRPLVKSYSVSLIEESIDNDRAIVLFKENDSDSLTKIQLVKEMGEWKVDLISSLAK